MALLSVSQIHKVLAEEPSAKAAKASGKGELPALLEKHGLTTDDVLDNLRSNMVAGETGAVRQKAIDTALRLNGLLSNDNVQGDFKVVINIIDPQYSEVNPILIPR